MSPPTFLFYLVLGVPFLSASIGCYLFGSASPALRWRRPIRLIAVVMLSSSFLSFGYCRRAYEVSRPPEVISGVVKTNWGYRQTDFEVRSSSGEVVSFDALGLAALDGQFARVRYLPLSHQVLSIEGRRSDGAFYDMEYHDKATFLTKWMLATALLLVIGSASVVAEGTKVCGKTRAEQ